MMRNMVTRSCQPAIAISAIFMFHFIKFFILALLIFVAYGSPAGNNAGVAQASGKTSIKSIWGKLKMKATGTPAIAKYYEILMDVETSKRDKTLISEPFKSRLAELQRELTPNYLDPFDSVPTIRALTEHGAILKPLLASYHSLLSGRMDREEKMDAKFNRYYLAIAQRLDFLDKKASARSIPFDTRATTPLSECWKYPSNQATRLAFSDPKAHERFKEFMVEMFDTNRRLNPRSAANHASLCAIKETLYPAFIDRFGVPNKQAVKRHAEWLLAKSQSSIGTVLTRLDEYVAILNTRMKKSSRTHDLPSSDFKDHYEGMKELSKTLKIDHNVKKSAPTRSTDEFSAMDEVIEIMWLLNQLVRKQSMQVTLEAENIADPQRIGELRAYKQELVLFDVFEKKVQAVLHPGMSDAHQKQMLNIVRTVFNLASSLARKPNLDVELSDGKIRALKRKFENHPMYGAFNDALTALKSITNPLIR
jgi:hypothetical protein